MKPYNAGGCDEVRCGRSTFRYPLALSTSYLIRSNGVISTNMLTTRGASSPAESPCHGWGRQREKLIAAILALREELFHLLQQRLVRRRGLAVEDRELFEEGALLVAERGRDAHA